MALPAGHRTGLAELGVPMRSAVQVLFALALGALAGLAPAQVARSTELAPNPNYGTIVVTDSATVSDAFYNGGDVHVSGRLDLLSGVQFTNEGYFSSDGQVTTPAQWGFYNYGAGTFVTAPGSWFDGALHNSGGTVFTASGSWFDGHLRNDSGTVTLYGNARLGEFSGIPGMGAS